MWIYEDDSFAPLAQISLRKRDTENDAEVYWYHNDVSGMPRELTGAGGEIAWRAEYRAWGNTLRVEHIATRTGEPVYQPLRYQGQYFDAGTGLHYNRFRYYDPDAGRFISQAPPGFAGGINLYQYAPNPLVWVDPLGLKCERKVIWTKKGWKHIYDRHFKKKSPRWDHKSKFEVGDEQDLRKIIEKTVRKVMKAFKNLEEQLTSMILVRWLVHK